MVLVCLFVSLQFQLSRFLQNLQLLSILLVKKHEFIKYFITFQEIRTTLTVFFRALAINHGSYLLTLAKLQL